jgi:hypothetical protein
MSRPWPGRKLFFFLMLTHLEPGLFLIHLYEAIVYIAILVMLFYMEDRWAYMIGMLVSVAWLVLAFLSGILGATFRELARLQIPASGTGVIALLALATASIAVLMIAVCGRQGMKEYSGEVYQHFPREPGVRRGVLRNSGAVFLGHDCHAVTCRRLASSQHRARQEMDTISGSISL